jgi:TDG/mug DNA glycosylase family protein
LFSGINPSLYSGAVGHHFARPGNRFWPTLHRAGFTERQLRPEEEGELLDRGIGITNIVPRTTARADELEPEELLAGARSLIRKTKRHEPSILAILGVTAFRSAFDRPRATIGRQPDGIGATSFWVLPNPSGLNAHYQLDDLVREFKAMRGEH